MILGRRQAAIVLLATALACGAAGCGDDDESPPAPQAAEPTQPATAPEPGEPAGTQEDDAQRRPDSEDKDEDGGERGAARPSSGAPQDAPRSVTSSEDFAEGMRRWRELRAQLADGNPEGDERAAEELEELERRFREALAEARQAQGSPGPEAPGYEFGEGPGFNRD